MEEQMKIGELVLEQRADGIYQGITEFPNGYGISVLFSQGECGFGIYSNGVDTFEVAVLKNGELCYDTPLTDDVLMYQSREQVLNLIEKIKAL